MTQGQIVSAPDAGIARPAAAGSMPTGGRWGWYRDHEGNEFRRVSKLVKRVETDTFNLDQWKLRQVALGLAKRDDLLLGVKAMGPEPEEPSAAKDYKKKLNGMVKEASEAAKTGRGGNRTGTAVHDLTERIDRGEPIEQVIAGLPAVHSQSLRAYEFLRRANGWRSVEIERTVVCDELEVAGSFDRIDLVPGLAALLGPGTCQHGHAPGEQHCGADQTTAMLLELPVVVDVKTEAQPWLNGLHIGPQLGIYSRARRMWRPTGGTVRVRYSATGDEVEMPAGEYVPAPCVRQDVAIVVHVLDGHAVPYFVNLHEGWEAAVAAYEQADREARAGRRLGAAGAWFVAMPGVKLPGVAQMLTEDAAARKIGHIDTIRAANALDGSEPIGTQVEVGGVTFVKHGELPALGAIATVPREPVAGEQVAVRGEDGLVRFVPAASAEPAPSPTLDEVDQGAVRVAWQATTVEALGVLWQTYTGPQVGRVWAGAVAQAADARRRQIECPQRSLHGGSGKCACGWVTGVAA